MTAPDLAVARPPSEGPRVLLIGILFCLSGVPALIYQISWQRLLVLQSGVGAVSVATIVAAYMGGLGIGSLAGGFLSRRLSPRGALITYAALELAIGGFALASGSIYLHGAYRARPGLLHAPLASGLGQFLALFPPTFAMGMSLPLFVRGLVRSGSTASRTIGELYGVNVLGAAIGAIVTPWVLIRHLGIPGAIEVGAGCNLAVGLGVLGAGLADSGPAQSPQAEDSPDEAGANPHDPRGSFALWAVLYASSGFYAIALEILWFRLIDVATKSTAFTFGTVLAVYLLGLAMGSLIGARLAPRVRDTLKAFLTCQCLILIYAGLGAVLLARLPTGTPGYRSLFAYWGGYEPLAPDSRYLRAIVLLYGGLPLALFGPPTCLMGLSFALVQRGVQDRRQTSGFKVGILQCVNIAGCVAGSLLVGLVLFPTLGTTGTLRMMIASGTAFAALGARYARPRAPFAVAGLLLIATAVLLPGHDRFWQRMHGQERGPALFEEDETGVVAVLPETPGRWRLSVNGKGQSWLPFGGVHSKLGALAATIHPAPERVAIIGLGSGDTAWAAACSSETRQVVVYEIYRTQVRLLRRLSVLDRLPHLEGFLNDRRITIVGEDGRKAIAQGGQRYDLIEADAIRPNGAYSGNLYSREFFRLCSEHLKPGGLMCSWSPTPRTHATFRRAFPHVLELADGAILIGSNQPIPFDPDAWRERMRASRVATYLGDEIVSECLETLSHARSLPTAPRRSHETNTDLFPRDEYQGPAIR